MNYQKIYDQIIDRAKTRQIEGYVEKHHIVPKCLGGNNSKNNIVQLTAREHFICHQLLVEIYPNEPKLKYALYLMNIGKRKNKNADYKISSRTYERLKKEHSLLMVGNKNCINRWQSQETRDKIGNANRKPKPKGFGAKPKGYSEKISKIHLGKTVSQETRDKISKSWENRIIGKGKGIKKPKVSEKISKPIIQYDIQMNFIQEWKSGKEASLFFNKKSTTAICQCCKNKRKTAYGYKWKYKS